MILYSCTIVVVDNKVLEKTIARLHLSVKTALVCVKCIQNGNQRVLKKIGFNF